MERFGPEVSYTIIRNEMKEIIADDIFDWRQRLFEYLTDNFNRIGVHCKIENRETFDLKLNGKTEEMPVRDSIAFIQNDLSKNYSVIDCHDWIEPDDTKIIIQDKRCEKVLKCQYDSFYLDKPEYDKVKRWTYFDRFWPTNEKLWTSLFNTKPTIDKIYFRGVPWPRRGAILDRLIEKGIMNSDYNPISFDDYIEEYSQYRIIFSMSGFADVCHRDIEGFASGRCIIRPKIVNSFHNDLIADHHYISLDIVYETPPDEAAEKIYKRFIEVIDDHEYLDFVVKNARKWYEENVSVKNVFNLTEKLLNLNYSAG